MFNKTISIIGGTGHVGLPLGLAFADKNYKVQLIDINLKTIKNVNKGIMPFKEDGAPRILKKLIKNKKIFATNDLEKVKFGKYVIICIGTPVNKKLKPETRNFLTFFKNLKKQLSNKHLVIIRSSVYPGISDEVFKICKNKTKNVSYCPERIVQGKSLIELPKLPQIVSGFTQKSINDSKKLFEIISKKIIVTSIVEAELIKLFSNSYRYIMFSISNQFFKICHDLNIDFDQLRKNMIEGYDRNSGIPKPGFTAGPCLLKDTMQLSSFLKGSFQLGYSAMTINESIPIFLIKDLEKKISLKGKTVGVLGMAFKAETDDIRDSLAIKLTEYLKKKKINFRYSDPYYKDKYILTEKELIKKSDIIIVTAPHKKYKKIRIPKNKIVIDIWNILPK